MAVMGGMGADMEVVVCRHAWKAKGLVVCQEMPGHFQIARWIHWIHPITPPSRCAALGRVESELVGLSGKALTTDATRRLSEWKLPLRGRITYRHCRQPKLPYFLCSSNRLLGGGATDAGNAAPTFCFSEPAMSKLTTLTVESLRIAQSEIAKHHILAIDEASQQQQQKALIRCPCRRLAALYGAPRTQMS